MNSRCYASVLSSACTLSSAYTHLALTRRLPCTSDLATSAMLLIWYSLKYKVQNLSYLHSNNYRNISIYLEISPAIGGSWRFPC